MCWYLLFFIYAFDFKLHSNNCNDFFFAFSILCSFLIKYEFFSVKRPYKPPLFYVFFSVRQHINPPTLRLPSRQVWPLPFLSTWPLAEPP